MIINADPNSAVFSSSSVMTYSNGSDGKPVVYQESKQIRQGPGGVKETREMVRDSSKNIEKVSVGHHIGERAHVIERQKLNGQIEEIVNLENLDEEEIQKFNSEFEEKIRQGRNANSHHHNHRSTHHPHSISSNAPFAIEDGSASNRRK
jgi:myeloid leukemia factor 1